MSLPIRPSAPEPFYRHLGSVIRQRREMAGMTQEDLAVDIGYTRTSIINIEHGRQRILAHTLLDIAHFLGCSAGDMLLEASEGEQGTQPVEADDAA